jgi:hypothetical protein
LHIPTREEPKHREVLQVLGVQDRTDLDRQQEPKGGLLPGICEPQERLLGGFSKAVTLTDNLGIT